MEFPYVAFWRMNYIVVATELLTKPIEGGGVIHEAGGYVLCRRMCSSGRCSLDMSREDVSFPYKKDITPGEKGLIRGSLRA